MGRNGPRNKQKKPLVNTKIIRRFSDDFSEKTSEPMRFPRRRTCPVRFRFVSRALRSRRKHAIFIYFTINNYKNNHYYYEIRPRNTRSGVDETRECSEIARLSRRRKYNNDIMYRVHNIV